MGSELHIVPTDDLVDHQTDLDCVCGPWVDMHEKGAVLVHHALDGRG